jgi:uncharacterized protein (TIGR03083 family)
VRPSEHVDALALESERFGKAARGALDVRVPSCPDWTLGHLVFHLASVQWVWNEIVRARALEREAIGQPDDRPDGELAPWFDEVSTRLVEALRSTDPAVRVWSWANGQQDVAWVARRQAHEAAVHRWDAQASTGTPEPIASDVAADGIEEFFDWMLTSEDVVGFEGELAVGLAPTDHDDARTIAIGDGLLDPRAGASPDLTIRGTASDLLLLLWRRVPPDDVVVEGDRASLERFLAVADLN